MRRRRISTAGEISVRPARPDDLTQLVEMIDRCTADTIYRRFHGAAGHAVRRELARIATPTPTHRSWVAVTAGGTVRGTATLAQGRSGITEAAFLVEDAWFRQGIGGSLFAALAAEAQRCELETVVASIQADNRRAQRFLMAMAPTAQTAFAGSGLLEVTIPVARRPVSRPALSVASLAAVVGRWG